MALGAQGCGESGVVASGVSTYETADALGTVMVERSVTRLIWHKDFLNSFCQSHFSHKHVNLLIMLVIVKDKLTWES